MDLNSKWLNMELSEGLDYVEEKIGSDTANFFDRFAASWYLGDDVETIIKAIKDAVV